MTKLELCNILRDRVWNVFLKVEFMPEEFRTHFERLSDEEVLRSYLICSDCGNKANNYDDIERVILEAVNVEEFLELTNFSCRH